MLLLITILAITSCATSVLTQYMVPAKYDMSNYRTLAIIPTPPYRFRAFDIPSAVVRDMSGTSHVRVYSGYSIHSERYLQEFLTQKVVEKAKNSTYFTIISPENSQTYKENITLMEKDGIDAILYLTTDEIYIDEFIFAKEEKKIIPSQVEGEKGEEVVELVYYLEQGVRVNFSWEVRSTSTSAILARDSYSDEKREVTKLNVKDSTTFYAPSLSQLMNTIASNFSTTIWRQLEPTVISHKLALMKNSPKNSRVIEAYDEVKNGNLLVAQQMFEREWRKRDHIPSLYNASIILEALDKRAQAIELLEIGYKKNGNTKVKDLLDDMKERESLTKQAESQFK